jgi:heat shock protein HslJ
MTRMMRLLLAGILLLISGCSLLPGSGSGLDGTSWKLVSYSGITPIPGREMTASFKDQEISGSASCNHYFGSYRTRGTALTIENLAWTEMACLDPEGIMEQEQELMRLLGSAASYDLQGDQLVITASSGEELVFTAYRTPNP